MCWLGCCALESPSLPAYGGQAVLEGVMMRGQRYMTVAVRAPDESIRLKVEELPRKLYRSKLTRIPVARGSLLLWDAMVLGFRALSFSADVALGQEDAPPEEASRATQIFTGLTTIFGVAVGIGLFFLLPATLSVPIHTLTQSAPLANFLEGVIRIVLLVGYLAVIGFIPDIRRVFMYHGAEHKAINALEAGAPLEAAEAQRYSIKHPRCGTNFLLIVAVMSVAVFTVIGRPESWLILLGSRILLVPLIAGLAYEVIRWSAKHMTNPAVAIVIAPGLALQTLSTRDPDDSQVEVAVHALRELLRLEAAPSA